MKRIGILVAAVLMVVLVLAFFLQPKAPSWILPDGSTLRLVNITWGTNHGYRYGYRLMDFVYPLVPARARTNFNFQVATVSAPPPGALMVWFKRTGIPTNAPTPRPATGSVTNTARGRPTASTTLARGSEPFMVSVADDFGVESRTSTDVRVAAVDNSTEIVGVVLGSYPRRAKSFGVRIHWSSLVRPASSGGSTTLLGELRITNPSGKMGNTAWLPEPLPATHTTNHLELTLKRLESGMTVDEANRRMGRVGRPGITPADINRRTYSRVAFEVKENGVATTNWGICRLVLSDAAGEGHPISVSSALLNPAEVVFPDSLWLDEPAWKLEVELARSAEPPPEELWFVKGFPAPTEGQSVTPDLATNLHGAEIKITGTTRARGPGGFAMPATLSPQSLGPNPPPMSIPGRPSADQLALNLQAPDSLRLSLVEVRDDQGHLVPLENSVQRPVSSRIANTPGKFVWLFQFNFPVDAKSVDLTIAVSPRRNFEFYVKPTLASADASPAK